MSETTISTSIFVYQNVENVDYFVGTLCVTASLNKEEFMSFEYSDEWLNSKIAYPLSSCMPLQKGVFSSNDVFKFFVSASYVRSIDFYYEYLLAYLKKQHLLHSVEDFNEEDLYEWFRTATNCSRKFCKKNGDSKFIYHILASAKRIIYQNDYIRNGAFRFKMDKNADFVENMGKQCIPTLDNLHNILEITRKIENNQASISEMNVFRACVSGLNGREPKTSVFDENNNLCIAKLSSVMPYAKYELAKELLALRLASKFGIKTQEYSIRYLSDGRKYLLIKRFDRIGEKRIPFFRLSSYLRNSQFEENDTITSSVIKLSKKNATKNLREIFKRQLFRVFICDSDDYVLNTAFLYNIKKGWEIAPEFDVIVNYQDVKKEDLKIYLNSNFKNSVRQANLLISRAHMYRLSNKKVRKMIAQLKKSLMNWQKEAINLGFSEEDLVKVNIYLKSFDKIKFSK